MMRDYDILFVFYDEDENAFYDVCGQQINNIFSIITPNDLFLYQHNPSFNKFFTPYTNVMCKICTMEEGEEFFDWGYKQDRHEPIIFRQMQDRSLLQSRYRPG